VVEENDSAWAAFSAAAGQHSLSLHPLPPAPPCCVDGRVVTSDASIVWLIAKSAGTRGRVEALFRGEGASFEPDRSGGVLPRSKPPDML
jgi:hypothetical protein